MGGTVVTGVSGGVAEVGVVAALGTTFVEGSPVWTAIIVSGAQGVAQAEAEITYNIVLGGELSNEDWNKRGKGILEGMVKSALISGYGTYGHKLGAHSSATAVSRDIDILNNESITIYKASSLGRGSVIQSDAYVTTVNLKRMSPDEIREVLDLNVGKLKAKYGGAFEVSKATTTWGNLRLPTEKWDSFDISDWASIGHARPIGLTASPGNRFAPEFKVLEDVAVETGAVSIADLFSLFGP